MDTKKLRQKILDLAIHGKLVPQDPNDEPASVLLERIRAEKERLIKEGKTRLSGRQVKRSKKAASDTPHYPDQVPFEVPESWEWTTIGSIFQHNTGKALNKSDSQEGLLKPYLTTSNVYWNSFDFTEVKEMYFKDSELEKCTVTKGDLLVCEGGDIGRAAIWSYDYEICIQNHIHRLRGIGQVCQILYLYVLMLYKWTDKIHGKGIGLQGLSSGLLDKLMVPLPPYEEQLRIVTAIDKWFSLINVLESAKGDLQISIAQAKSKILDLAIHGKLVPQDPNDEPAIDLLRRINPKFTPCDNAHYENVPFEIPKSWRWTCMAEVNEYNSASVDPSKSPDIDFELYSVPAYETGMPEFVKGKDISSSKKVVTRNDVLLCKINPHLNRAWIVSHYKENIPCLASSEWIIFRNSAICPQYLSFCFTSNYFKELMLSNVSGVGGSLMRAQPAIVYKYLFPLPPINEQRRIVAAIQKYYVILDDISANL